MSIFNTSTGIKTMSNKMLRRKEITIRDYQPINPGRTIRIFTKQCEISHRTLRDFIQDWAFQQIQPKVRLCNVQRNQEPRDSTGHFCTYFLYCAKDESILLSFNFNLNFSNLTFTRTDNFHTFNIL